MSSPTYSWVLLGIVVHCCLKQINVNPDSKFKQQPAKMSRGTGQGRETKMETGSDRTVGQTKRKNETKERKEKETDENSILSIRAVMEQNELSPAHSQTEAAATEHHGGNK